MRRPVLILIMLLFCRLPLEAGQTDMSARDTINVYSSVTDYLEAISVMPVDSIISRCSVLIDSAEDPQTQAQLAGLAFDFYADSPIMGVEGVSVYIADNYFLNKRLEWNNPDSYPLLYTFAEFNRSSLLGQRMAPLSAESLEGGMVDLCAASDGYKILYFYEDRCATCTVQTPRIISFLNQYDGEIPVTLYAFYTQSDKEAWTSYVFKNFHRIANPKVTVINVWDPEGASAFHKNYSVLTTPSLFLVDEDNTICGRKLDAEALSELLGSKNSFFDSLYSLMGQLGENLGFEEEALQDVCAAFAARTADDIQLYRDTFYGIFSYLRAQNDLAAQNGAAMVAEQYILGQREKWSPELLQMMEHSVAMYRLNPVGGKASDATLLNRRGKEKHLSDLCGRKYTVLFFNLISCADCRYFRQELEEMEPVLKKNGARVISIYVGPDESEWQEELRNKTCRWKYLRAEWPEADIYSLYDLSIVPKIYLIDKEGTVIAKDIPPATLKEIFQQ